MIELKPDYECFPLWEASEDGFGNIDPTSLPISRELQLRLLDWGDLFTETLDRQIPQNSGFHSVEQALRFSEEGLRLARDLQIELGNHYKVIYNSMKVFGVCSD